MDALKYYKSLQQNIEHESTRYMAMEIYFDEDYKDEQFLNDYSHIICIHKREGAFRAPERFVHNDQCTTVLEDTEAGIVLSELDLNVDNEVEFKSQR